MHVYRKIYSNWLENYSVKEVYKKDKLYLKTIKYLKNQKLIKYSKILFLLNCFENKKYPVCYVIVYKNKIVGFVGTIFSKKKIIINIT